ncbi:hypothetical protein D5W64_12435 [Salmonella enterica subsp. enterica serovar Saintpaul]|nr:hypothetical protein [Salmonella enterica subsp. enterica serovar Saintpaul]
MQQNPTCYQYLLNIFTQSKLDIAAKLKDPAARAKQERFYTNVKETECVFSRPVLKDGKWSVDITCAGRGWKYQGLRFNTGGLLGLVGPKANYTIELDRLRTQTITGLYYAVDKETLHLVVQPKSNIWEALQMTGYSFSPSEFSVVDYETRDETILADGHVDIRNKIVAGRIYITHVARHTFKPEAVVEETTAPATAGIQEEPKDLPEAVIKGESVETTPELSEEEQIQKLLDQEKEVANEPATGSEEVVEEKPVQQKVQKKGK